ncbi:hypothetical protein K469DRAFT_697999 [Zopfia rhizophila CBS 207.26]|uniref:Uncharacterized protein n=1 Tax=Zopfia rhizophila CBS 207.26 TaxID=1314779 RepID=A0A6A6EGD6_9PEZI|nr:hypothetical protein K469DRAFT_697999 [Zopfia rhizophila CBS 207.26]
MYNPGKLLFLPLLPLLLLLLFFFFFLSQSSSLSSPPKPSPLSSASRWDSFQTKVPSVSTQDRSTMTRMNVRTDSWMSRDAWIQLNGAIGVFIGYTGCDCTIEM